jgi:hypothetical protein
MHLIHDNDVRLSQEVIQNGINLTKSTLSTAELQRKLANLVYCASQYLTAVNCALQHLHWSHAEIDPAKFVANILPFGQWLSRTEKN